MCLFFTKFLTMFVKNRLQLGLVFFNHLIWFGHILLILTNFCPTLSKWHCPYFGSCALLCRKLGRNCLNVGMNAAPTNQFWYKVRNYLISVPIVINDRRIYIYIYILYPLPKLMAVFLCFWFLKTFQVCFEFWRQYNRIGLQYFQKTKSRAKCLTQCVPRFKCDTILFFKIMLVLRDLWDLVKSIFFVKISTSRNWHPYSISTIFYGNRASRYETVTRKFRPSVAFEWQCFLQTATVSKTDAQRWRVVGTSVAGINAAAIGRIFYIPRMTVRGILAR